MKTFTRTLTLGLALAGLIAGTALADQKTYHAAFCKAANGVESEFGRSEYRITKQSGAATNALLCPIVHDVFDCAGTFGCVKGVNATIQVFDYHTGGDVSCSLTARNATGSSYWWSTDTTAFAPGNDTLYVYGSSQWEDLDSYLLKCTMPVNGASGTAKIYSYMVYEYD